MFLSVAMMWYIWFKFALYVNKKLIYYCPKLVLFFYYDLQDHRPHTLSTGLCKLQMQWPHA